jgi:hypothetical protein
MSMNDFDRVVNLITDFCDQKHIIEVHESLQDAGELVAWEHWLHVEFRHFLHHNDGIDDWEREETYLIDQRKNNSKSAARVDFSFRWKRTKATRIILEFKAKYNYRNCIKAMIEDVKKIESLRKSEKLDIRNFYVVGFHSVEEDMSSDTIAEAIDDEGINFIYYPIGDSGCAVTIF